MAADLRICSKTDTSVLRCICTVLEQLSSVLDRFARDQTEILVVQISKTVSYADVQPGLPHISSPIPFKETAKSLERATSFKQLSVDERRKYCEHSAKTSQSLRTATFTDGNGREIVDVDKIDETDADALQKHAERYLDLADKARTAAAVKVESDQAEEPAVCAHPTLLCPSGFRIDGGGEPEVRCPECGRTLTIHAAPCDEACDACTDGTASLTF